MIILGLTGSIGMGKSTAAGMLRRLAVPVHDADATVHKLLGFGGAAVSAVAEAFPETLRDGAIDRPTLGAAVFNDREALRRLEGILHPLVRADSQAFLKRQARRRARLVCLDIPLLFETNAESRCDTILVVTAPPFVQAARVLRRPGMTRERFESIRATQVSDVEKRRHADFVVPTGLGKRETLRRLAAIVKLLRAPKVRIRDRRRGIKVH